MSIRYPVSQPDLTGNEEAYVTDAVRSTWISSSGAYLARFEEEFAGKCSVNHALGVANGTVALHLAMLTMDAGPGDEVIVPSFTYIATANAVRYVGAEPVFVDVDPANWCMDPAKVAEAVTERTVGILAVHVYGHPADMATLRRIADQKGLWLMEDAAEAHFATCHGEPVGSLSDIATFSFYGNKLFTSGEGGAVVLNDGRLADKARLLRGQGMDPERRYYFPVIGYNFRMTNLEAALLCAQLERHEEIYARRRRIFEQYRNALEGIPGVSFQPTAEWAVTAPWLYNIVIDPEPFGTGRDGLAVELRHRGIDTRPLFLPLHHMPPYSGPFEGREEPLPYTVHLGYNGISLPTYNALTERDIREITDAVREIQQSV